MDWFKLKLPVMNNTGSSSKSSRKRSQSKLQFEKLERRELLAADLGTLASDIGLDLTGHGPTCTCSACSSLFTDEPHGIEMQAQRNDADGSGGGSNQLNVGPPRPITERVTIQPIVVSNSDGSNTAGYFGTDAERAIIEGHIDTIWAQAGIDIAWLPARSWNNTFANVGNQNPRPTNDLDVVGTSGDNAGVGNSDPLVLDMYFVEVAAGFGPRSTNVANGLAWVGDNGITIHVGDDLTRWGGGQEVVARVAAHEIGHNLGLSHLTVSGNLMTPSSGSEQLNNAQINSSLNSRFSVPLPANSAPTIANPLPDITMNTDATPRSISLASVFNDVDGDPLTYQVSSNNSAILAAVSGSTLTLTVNSTSAANAVINVTANDGQGGTVTDSFAVNLRVPPPASTNLGTLDFTSLENVSNSGTRWYRLDAARTGLLTAVGEWSSGAGVEVSIFDSNINLVQTGSTSGNSSRVDVAAVGGEEYYIRVVGTNTINLQVANLVNFAGSTVTASGTASADELLFSVGTTHAITINGIPYSFPASSYTTFNLNTAGGADKTTIIDGPAAETFTARPLNATFAANNGQYTIQVNDSENVVAHSVSGGTDFAEFYDGATTDHFYASPTVAFLYSLSGEFNNTGVGFETTRARKTSTGNDIAIFVDSAGNDEFIATTTSSKLSSQLNTFSNEAVGFQTNHSYATAGGVDTAQLYDSTGNDTFYSDSTQAFIQNSNFVNFAANYENVEAFSTAGGTDTAILFDGTGNDTFEAFPTRAIMQADSGQFRNQADAFELVYGYSRNGGVDTATLNGSTGADNFTASPEFSLLEGVDAVFSNYATDFETVIANGNGGNDLASLFDSNGNDQVNVESSGTTLNIPGTSISARSFPTVYATSSRGGVDTLTENLVSYTFIAVGPWI